MTDRDGPFPFEVARAIDAARKGFPVATGEDPSITILHDGDECKHPHVTINARDRTLTCDRCHAGLDPFDVLVRISSGEKRMQKQADIIEKERQMQKGFYEQKRTVNAMKCRHTHRYTISAGVQKCLRCDHVIKSETIPMRGTPDAD